MKNEETLNRRSRGDEAQIDGSQRLLTSSPTVFRRSRGRETLTKTVTKTVKAGTGEFKWSLLTSSPTTHGIWELGVGRTFARSLTAIFDLPFCISAFAI
jgi:hypothetical protein